MFFLVFFLHKNIFILIYCVKLFPSVRSDKCVHWKDFRSLRVKFVTFCYPIYPHWFGWVDIITILIMPFLEDGSVSHWYGFLHPQVTLCPPFCNNLSIVGPCHSGGSEADPRWMRMKRKLTVVIHAILMYIDELLYMRFPWLYDFVSFITLIEIYLLPILLCKGTQYSNSLIFSMQIMTYCTLCMYSNIEYEWKLLWRCFQMNKDIY